MKLFNLFRKKDVNGFCGIGVISEGVIFTDGTVCMKWLSDISSTVIYKSIDDVIKIHGHNGDTELKYIEEMEIEILKEEQVELQDEIAICKCEEYKQEIEQMKEDLETCKNKIVRASGHYYF